MSAACVNNMLASKTVPSDTMLDITSVFLNFAMTDMETRRVSQLSVDQPPEPALADFVSQPP